MLREIVSIDEERCNGCGLCIPACQEGAIQLIDGKARLVAENLCDGLGACLGHCPQDAIRVERREAEVFDESAVEQHLAGQAAEPAPVEAPAGAPAGCPSARFARLGQQAVDEPAADADDDSESASELRQWPVQLRLLPPTAPMLRGASLLLAADCVPVAYGEFHRRMLRGRALAIACPKLDDPTGYIEKLTEIIRANNLTEVEVVHMEVPCCTGLLRMAAEARRRSGRDVPLIDTVVSVEGRILSRRPVPVEALV
jgi:NAD-dependent dihydropyrimidine dehydrogenase PreA subunit